MNIFLTTILPICNIIVIPVISALIFNKLDKKHTHQLNKQLESLKGEISRSNDLYKIEKEHLQEQKIDKESNLVKEYFMKMFDKNNLKLMQDKQFQKEFVTLKQELSIDLFMFGSDETVKQFVQLEKMNKKLPTNAQENKERIIALAKLLTQIRKDMGYKDTSCDYNDILNMLLTDWDKYE